jgi:hypothetical protein
MVTSATPEDRTTFVQWIFGLATLHPDLTSMSTITPKQRDELSRKAGALFEKLLLDSCRSQAQAAFQNEGPQTLQYAFQVFGQAASVGLFTNPQVTAGAKDLAKYVDKQKLEALTVNAKRN